MAIDVTGIGAVADLASNLMDRFFPNKTEQEKAQMAAALTIMQGQLDVNKEEAKNPNLFVSGWRPAIGWTCVSACTWNWVGLPVGLFIAKIAGYPIDMSPADLTEMLPILIGMLGLGTLQQIPSRASARACSRRTLMLLLSPLNVIMSGGRSSA
jgi:Holin of 3TMs, for gene-transfer release